MKDVKLKTNNLCDPGTGGCDGNCGAGGGYCDGDCNG